MEIQESGEMYLETILLLKEKLDIVRAIDIGKELGYSKPSVSRALGILKDRGYILVDDNGSVTLTSIGETLAKDIYDKHLILTDALIKIGVAKDVAESDACKIEHVISKETFDAIKKYVNK